MYARGHATKCSSSGEARVLPPSRVCHVSDRRHGGGGDRAVKGSPKRVVLVCEECGEKTVLDGPPLVWLSGGASFGCGCGEQLATAERLGSRTVDRRGARLPRSSSRP